MRLKGKLIKWDAQKAFGFIAPNGGGDHIFIHKTAFSNRQRPPQINDVITFSITKDKQGRYCAGDATFSGEKLKVKQAKNVSKFSIYLSIVFVGALVSALVADYMPMKLVLAYLGLSAVTYLMYAYDKSKAQSGAWRTPESTLHLFSIAGGWPGAAIAQQILRHKSKKKEFRVVFWLTVIVNCGALAWLMSPNGTLFMDVFK